MLGYIDDNKIKQLIPEGFKNSFEVMIASYKLLENALKEKEIDEIQIFLNMIYPKLSNTLKLCPLTNTKEIRENVENKINEIIESSIQGYKDYKTNYINYNNEINKINIKSLRIIIQESIDPSLYPENDFPFFRFFMVPKYANKKQLIEELNLIPQSEQKYPIITNYLKDNGEIEVLQNLIKINPFVNSMIEQYTYKKTRAEAKELKIKDELDRLNNQLLVKQFKEFLRGWYSFCDFLKRKQQNPEIKEKYLLEYNNRQQMEIKYIKESDPIAFVLNDDGEVSYGMYLAAAYQKFINWQNSFLNNIIENISQSGVLHYFKDQLKKEIYAQDATNTEIVNLNLDNDTSLYNSFNEIFTVFSRRNCFDKGKINYSNYKNIQYDFDLIEEEIGKIILPGKKLFKNSQRFVTYGFEGYRGGNSTVIQDFIKKYKQNPLEKAQRKILFEYTENNRIDYNGLMFSLQLLIFYLKNENYPSDSSIHQTIEKIPDFVKINEDCKDFFRENQDFQLNILISIFEYFELLCYNQIVDNVNEEYKKEIEREQIEKIDNYFNKNEGKLINKMLLATIVRRFISRRLSGKRGDNEIKSDDNLLYIIQTKEEFWPKEIIQDPKFNIEFKNMIYTFKVNVNQSIKFYDILGGDKELLGDKKEFEEKEEEKKDNDGEEPFLNEEIKKEKKPRKRKKLY